MLHVATGTLSSVQPFDFKHSLNFLGLFKPAMGQQVIENNTLTKAFYVADKVVVFRASHTTAAPQLDYAIWSEQPLTSTEQQKAVEDISFFLSLQDDLNPFYTLAESDPDFMQVVQKLYGYHQVKFSLTAFENACWAVISQRNLMSLSFAMKARLTEQYGGRLQVEGLTYQAFPQPHQLALATTDELNQIIRNTRKAECINAVAQAFANMDEMWLREAPLEQVKKWLLSIKGIGAWSASFVLVRGLGRVEELPVDEKRLLEAARRVYRRPGLTFADIPKLATDYGAYQGYWAHYLRAGG
ncbi:MAG: DNA-3-methyladenine glycosylase 2 family protein [Anaerolineae bacterium]